MRNFLFRDFAGLDHTGATRHLNPVSVNLNIDENPLTPQKYNVRGIPTLLIFKNGEVVAEKVGALPKSQLEGWIDQTV